MILSEDGEGFLLFETYVFRIWKSFEDDFIHSSYRNIDRGIFSRYTRSLDFYANLSDSLLLFSLFLFPLVLISYPIGAYLEKLAAIVG